MRSWEIQHFCKFVLVREIPPPLRSKTLRHRHSDAVTVVPTRVQIAGEHGKLRT